MAEYSGASPWKNTPSFENRFLDVWVARNIPKQADDILFTITQTYAYRPDNLAFDLYGDSRLWWVFAARNKNTITDPVWDFTPGTKIYLPKKATLATVLGL